MLVDTHCHLTDREAFPDVRAAIEEAREAGVDRFVTIGIEPESCERAVQLAEEHEEVYAVVGHHPNHAATFEPSLIQWYESWAAHPKVLAIGEIGLDYHWDFASPEQQRAALFAQLELAESLEMPIVFHCREAGADLAAILRGRSSQRWLMHCFAGDADLHALALETGCMLGLGGPLTYKNAENLRRLVFETPREQIVLETDSPYLPPHPYRGKPNKPAWVSLVADRLAELWEVSREDVANLTRANSFRLFPKLG